MAVEQLSYKKPSKPYLSYNEIYDYNEDLIRSLDSANFIVFTKYYTPPSKKTIDCVQINGERYIIDEKLKHISTTINNSNYLLKLEEDWDSDGALGINELVYYRAIKLLVTYSKSILKNFEIAIKSPDISAGRDGSIDLNWKNENSGMLITILNTPDFNIHYYGDDGNNNTVIKGFLTNAKR